MISKLTAVIAALSQGFWSGAYLVKRALYRFSVRIDLASYLGQWGDLLPIHSQLDILGALLVSREFYYS